MRFKPAPYRSKLRICYDILLAIRSEGGECGPTRILYKANLSHDRLTKYLSMLLEKDLIEEIKAKGKTIYRLTPRGREFIREFEKVDEFARAFGFTI